MAQIGVLVVDQCVLFCERECACVYFAHVGAANRPRRNGARRGCSGFGSRYGADAGTSLDRLLAGSIFCGTSLGIAMLLFGVSGKMALASAFLVGMGLGAEGDIIAYSLTRYFGLKAFGSAYGYAFGSFLLAGALCSRAQ